MSRKRKIDKIPMHSDVMDVAVQQYGRLNVELMDIEEANAKPILQMLKDSALKASDGPSDAAHLQVQRLLALANVMDVFKPFDAVKDCVEAANAVISQQLKLSEKFNMNDHSLRETKRLLGCKFVSAHCAGEAEWDVQMQEARKFVRNILYASSRFTYPKGFKTFDDDAKREVELLKEAIEGIQKELLTAYDLTPAVRHDQIFTESSAEFIH